MSKFSTCDDMRAQFDKVTTPSFKTASRSKPPLAEDDKDRAVGHTQAMNDTTREELAASLSSIEERMDKRAERMEKEADRRSTDFRNEITLRDDSLRRELELRRESSLIEQAARDKALEEKINGFLSAQVERDRLYNEKANSVFRRLDDRDQVIDSKLALMESSLLQVKSTVDGFEDNLKTSSQDFQEKLSDGLTKFNDELKDTLKGVKSSNWNTGIAILAMAAATVLGIWGANSTIIGSAVGIFDGGRNSAEHTMQVESLLRDSKAQSESTYQLLRQIQEQQKATHDSKPAKSVRSSP